MPFLDGVALNQTVIFNVATHSPSGGQSQTADELPKFWVFENENDTPIIAASSLVERVGFPGFYRAKLIVNQPTFSVGNSYGVLISGKVDGIKGFLPIDFVAVTGTPQVNVVQLTGSPITSVSFNPHVYFARVRMDRDTTNGFDEYVSRWYRNDTLLGSGEVSSPNINVIKVSDGSDLIPFTGMSYISVNTGNVKYIESVAGRKITTGEPYIIRVSATLDGSVRVWEELLSRDG